ncbi:hypothetical protein CEXT_180671 [Caerostris extrusa]|uniref:Uncharacterized protein n=1 Tax=Caerostris extrusa TaxID=172846 RepID=A0AAV4XGU3_CAEEX|nr:hypothetical protein CEXT_180671 [Caerostris extrusa]
MNEYDMWRVHFSIPEPSGESSDLLIYCSDPQHKHERSVRHIKKRPSIAPTIVLITNPLRTSHSCPLIRNAQLGTKAMENSKT